MRRCDARLRALRVCAAGTNHEVGGSAGPEASAGNAGVAVDEPSVESGLEAKRHPLGATARARMVRRADSSSASVSPVPATRMIRRRPWRMIRPGRLIREKRSAFIRRATHAGPSTSRFITAFRLWARIMIVHHAALAPNSPLGIRPPARSVFMTAWTSSLLPQRSRSHQMTWSPGSVRFADRQEAVVGTPPAVPGPGRHEADLGELLVSLVTLAFDGPVQRLPVRVGHGPGSLAELLGHIGADRELDHPEPRVLAFSTVQQQVLLVAGRVRPQINLGYAGGRRRGQAVLQHPKLLVTSRDIAVSELRVQHDALFRPPAVQRLLGLEPLVA